MFIRVSLGLVIEDPALFRGIILRGIYKNAAEFEDAMCESIMQERGIKDVTVVKEWVENAVGPEGESGRFPTNFEDKTLDEPLKIQKVEIFYRLADSKKLSAQKAEVAQKVLPLDTQFYDVAALLNDEYVIFLMDFLMEPPQ